MANRIRRLPEESVRQIAAGEVVERPASAVKELLENALDAGASSITLEIETGGKTLIRVSDDGCGMTEADARLALENHTTSKISSFSDLDRLSTFGFRGEALPSLAAISKLTLTTRTQDSNTAIQIRAEGPKIIETKGCGRSPGTTVEVRDLFFNVPARLKFMRSDASEKTRILKTFEEIAAAHPEITFELRAEGRKAQTFPARQNGLARVRELWSGEFSQSSFLPLSFRHPKLSITGWISGPSEHRPSKNYQLLYVNRRPIFSRSLNHALYEACRDSLPVGRHPAAVMFLEIEPSEVDVNAHPSKREVKFRNEGQVYECLVKEIRLKRSRLAVSPRALDMPFELPAAVRTPSFSFDERQQAPARSTASSTQVETRPKTLARTLCQLESIYIVAEKEGGLVIVDQHAASERVVYERLLSQFRSGGKLPAQPLLIPYLWNVSLEHAEALRAHLPELENLGMIFEEFGERTFRLMEAPAGLNENDVQSMLDEILVSLETDKNPQIFSERQIIRTACHSAVRAGERLANSELDKILNDLALCENPHTCPHGRPTTLTLPRAELDKKFGRDY